MQIQVLIALGAPDVREGGQVFARLGHVAGEQVRLADVLVRAAVPGVKMQRSAVVVDGFVVLALAPSASVDSK